MPTDNGECFISGLGRAVFVGVSGHVSCSLHPLGGHMIIGDCSVYHLIGYRWSTMMK